MFSNGKDDEPQEIPNQAYPLESNTTTPQEVLPIQLTAMVIEPRLIKTRTIGLAKVLYKIRSSRGLKPQILRLLKTLVKEILILQLVRMSQSQRLQQKSFRISDHIPRVERWVSNTAPLTPIEVETKAANYTSFGVAPRSRFTRGLFDLTVSGSSNHVPERQEKALEFLSCSSRQTQEPETPPHYTFIAEMARRYPSGGFIRLIPYFNVKYNEYSGASELWQLPS
ncbi:hypothetical protein MMC12_007067 [Toensbergia leucococca]|nr:hypothetical protein [Toensbergia leucococca]